MSRVLACLFLVFALANACDLVNDKWRLQNSFVIDYVYADQQECAQSEGCLGGPGRRKVLRFDSAVTNQGYYDCTLGWTPACPGRRGGAMADQYPFHFDNCHYHWHLTGMSYFSLTDPDTGVIAAEGNKNGLCLMDVVCGRRKYSCANQGLSVGCQDVYDKGLACQWIDITDIDDDKTYLFEWRTNEKRNIKETDYSNNVIRVNVDLRRVPHSYVPMSPAPNQCTRFY